MTVVDELFYKIGFEVDQKALDSIGSKFRSAAKTVDVLAKAALATGAAVFALTDKIASNLDDLDEFATSVGISTDELQKLRFVAERTGVGADGINNALKFMIKNLNDIDGEGAAAADSLAIMGINAEEIQKLKPEQQMKVIADGLAGISDTGKRAKIAMDIFGKGGVPMITMLKEGSAAIDEMAAKMPFIADAETIKRASDFKDSMQEFFAVIGSVTTMLASEMFPVIQDITKKIGEWVVQNKDLIRSGLRTFLSGVYFMLKVIVIAVEFLLRVLSIVGTVFEKIQPYLNFIASGVIAVAIWRAFVALRSVWMMLRAITGLQLVAFFLRAAFAAGTFWSATFLPIALFVAAVAAAALVIDDLWAWFEGRDSVVGMLLGPFDDWFTRFKGGLVALKETIFGFFNEIKSDPVWRALAGGIAGMAVGGPVGAAIGAVAGFTTGDQNKMVTNNSSNTVTNNMSVSGVNDPHAAAAILDAHQRRQSNVATQNSNKDSR